MSKATFRLSSALAVVAAASLSACSKSSDPAPAQTPAIALSTASLSFSATVGGADPAPQNVSVSNSGAGTLTGPSTSVAYVSGSGWLEVSVSGSAAPYTVTAQPRTTGLAVGTYQATISVASAGASNTPQAIAVTFTVGAVPPVPPAIALSSASLSFSAVAGGASPAAQGVTVTNGGGGTLALPTTSISYTSGSGWLGAVVSGSAAPYTVTVQAATGSLTPGTYTATVSVASAGASNSPRTIAVTFTVYDGSQPLIGLSSSSLSFTAQAGSGNPSSQNVTVSNIGSGTLAVPTTSISYGSGSGWLTAPVSGSAAPYTVTVQPATGSLGPGTYTATVSVASSGAGNTPQSFAVTFVVTAPPAIGLSAASLSFTGTVGGANPPPQTVSVSNTGGGTLAPPSTSDDAAWLTTVVSGSAAPFTITVQATTGSLAVGTYNATVSVASTGASNTPRTFAVSFTVVPEPPPCAALGATCSTGGECCSAICSGTPKVCATDAFCASGGAPCATDNDCCSMSCTNAGAPGATCAPVPCTTTGSSCTNGSTCCSGVCTGGSCAPLPPGPTNSTCTTLGERCDGALECCSHNCQGGDPTTPATKEGWCAPAYSCNAPGDVCWRPQDCCSGLCAPPAAPGQPGRCDDASGGCAQDGVPCDNDSNCCTRLCVDLGSGTKVCQPAGGCRMTGNYCDSTASCCNINQTLPGGDADSKAVHCSPTDHTCDNGGACNPPGNICGASTDVNASQNCCHEGTGSGKPVCKPDSNGILRCFGGPVNQTCPTGWDPYNPLCCIQPADICQFRDQCCGGAPCVPDPTGVLRCAAVNACVPRGMSCTPASPDPCCTGTTCDPESLTCLEPPGTCLDTGGACNIPPGPTDTPCCSGICVPSTPGGSTGTCAACAPTGNSCSADAQCCSGVCDPTSHVCVAPCVGDSGTCTADADCCVGLSCNIPPGQTSGTCGTGGGSCAGTGQTCNAATPCCNTADSCTNGVCTPPQTCSGASQSCTVSGNECCPGFVCLESNPSPPPPAIPCTATGTCFCDLDSLACIPTASSCTYGGAPCCAGSTCTVVNFPTVPCPNDPEASCACTP